MIAWDLTVFYRRGDTGGGQGLHGLSNSDSVVQAARDAARAAREWADRTGSTIKAVPGRLLINGVQGPIDLPGLDGSSSLDEVAAGAEDALHQWQVQQRPAVPEYESASAIEPEDDGTAPRSVSRGGELTVLWQDLAATAALEDVAAGATDDDLDAAENHTGYQWPDEVRELFQLQGGGIEIVPMFRLLSLDETLTTWDMWTQINDDLRERWPEGSAPDEAAIRSAPAGSPAEVFIPDLIPIADDAAGTSLCVDTRPGDLHSCVVEYSASAGGSRPLWVSVNAMIATVVDSIRNRRPLHDGWTTTTTGTLIWYSDD
ncbi:SMI1/KNR4 family protein [Rhodococcus sp. NPDC047139]|uniref:SMI1/KNR4 family protein n=1 Tax=Rhodococcus TaxID=1827 RepID=UPI0033F126B8